MPISGPDPRRGVGRSGRPERRDGRSRRPFRDAKRTGDSTLAAPRCQTAIRRISGGRKGAGGRVCRGRSPPARGWPAATPAGREEAGRKQGRSRGEPVRGAGRRRDSAGGRRNESDGGSPEPAGRRGGYGFPAVRDGTSPTEGGRSRPLSPEGPPRAVPPPEPFPLPLPCPGAPGRAGTPGAGADPEAGSPRPTGTTSSRRGRLPFPRTGAPGWRPAGRPHPPAGRTSGAPGARFPRGPAGP